MNAVNVTTKETVTYTIAIGQETAAKLEALLSITQRFSDEGEAIHTDLEDLYLSLFGYYSAKIVDGEVVLTKESV